MTSADAFTRADPLYRQAVRHGANSGSGFEVSSPTTPSGHIIAAVVGCVLAVLLIVVEGVL